MKKESPKSSTSNSTNPITAAGENIWFKGYLVNAVTLAPMRQSRYIYVELIDRNNTVQQRIKIRADEHGFHNCLKLPPRNPARTIYTPGLYAMDEKQRRGFFLQPHPHHRKSDRQCRVSHHPLYDRRKRTMHRRNRFHRFGEKAHCKSKTHLPACIGRPKPNAIQPKLPNGENSSSDSLFPNKTWCPIHSQSP